ncbi:MAG: DUF4932 domain-containing protein [Phycisphaerales bacterium]|nr:DUF4932 domain-containing protein [Phycisphaerales bacterium]
MHTNRIGSASRTSWMATVALGLFLSLAGRVRSQQPDAMAVPVRVDERVELMSIVFRLVGAREYTMAPTATYVQEVDAHFGPFKEHATIQLAAKLRAERGISYDAVASYAVHLKGGPQLEPKIPFDDPKVQLESRWSPQAATEFLAALQQFADDSKAFEFFDAHRDFYDAAAQKLEAEIARRPYRQWIDGYFGASPGASFTGIVGLLNGGGNYGVKVVYPDGRLEILPIIGASRFDDAGLPVFSADDAGTITHEFCHSFCNPLVDANIGQMRTAAEQIYRHRAAIMKQQAYGSAQTMLYESMVRACTHRFLVAHGSDREAAAALRNEVARGFLWTPELSELLAEYEQSRETYPTLASFMPRIVALFDEVAQDIEDRMAALPHVVRLTPPDGARDVSPDLEAIVIEFDKPMNPGGMSVVGRPADTPPSTQRGRFEQDDRVFVLPVRLEPGRTYRFSLNSIGYSGFRSADGWPLDPVAVTFSTAPR